MLKLLNCGYFTANLFCIKSDCKGTLTNMPHSIRSKCHKQISKQKVYGCERPLGLFSSLLLHTAKPQHPGANCTKCHLLLRTWCHLALFRKLEQSPGPSCCLGLWQQPRTHNGTSSDTKTKPSQPQKGRSGAGCELQRAQLQACIPAPIEGSSPDGKEEPPQHLTQTSQ